MRDDGDKHREVLEVVKYSIPTLKFFSSSWSNLLTYLANYSSLDNTLLYR